MGIFLQWPGWPSRHIDRIAAAGLESHGRSARNTYTGYACEGSIHLSRKVPALARRTGMLAACFPGTRCTQRHRCLGTPGYPGCTPGYPEGGRGEAPRYPGCVERLPPIENMNF